MKIGVVTTSPGVALALVLLIPAALVPLASEGSRAVASGPPAQTAGPAVSPLVHIAPFVVENRGQRESDTLFYAGGARGEMAFTATGYDILRVLSDPSTEPSRFHLGSPRAAGAVVPGPAAGGSTYRAHTVSVAFVGSSNQMRAVGADRLDTRVSYFKGPRDSWHTDLPAFGGVVYRDVWPGIDLGWTGVADGMKYTYVVAPGADPGRIRLGWSGADSVEVAAGGGLEIETEFGTLEDEPPYAYQLRNGHTETVRVSSVALPQVAVQTSRTNPSSAANDHTSATDPSTVTGFAVGAYDRSRPLYIDPVLPVYGGFLGFGGTDRGLGIALDGERRAYVTGSMVAPNEMTDDAYVARLNQYGNAVEYLAFIGGSAYEGGFDIDVDADGSAYITGYTTSDQATFPVSGGPDKTYNGVADTMIAKLSPDGSDLAYAGFLGGELVDFGEGIRVDESGSAYVFGPTLSSQATFPVTRGPDLTFNGETDAFVCKVVPEPVEGAVADNLIYCGYVGGDAADIDMVLEGADAFYSLGHLFVDADGAAYVSGATTSDEATFPSGSGFGQLPGADRTYGGGTDAYLAKIVPDGSGLSYATFVGGIDDDTGKGVAVDSGGAAYMTGYAGSNEETMPVTVGPDLTHNGGDLDALVVKLAPDGSAFRYLGYLGGTGVDGGESVAVDADGSLVIVGYSDSDEASFPVVAGPDLTQNDWTAGSGDAMIARVRPDPSAADPASNLEYAGFIGGKEYDQAFWVDLDADGHAYVVGDTQSGEGTFPGGDGLGDLPSWDPTFGGDADGFAVKVYSGDTVPIRPPDPTATPTATGTPSPAPAYLPVAHNREPAPMSPVSGSPGLLSADPPRTARSAGEVRPAAGSIAMADAPPYAGPMAQPAMIETSYDDFCDFGIGWAWEDSADLEAHIAADERLRCYYGSLFHRETAWGAVSSGHSASGEFAVETEFTLTGSGGLGGMMFGVPAAFTTWYIFAVSDTGDVVLAKAVGGQTTPIVRGSATFDPAQPVRLMVTARGNELVGYVNGDQILTADDSGPHDGRVGVYAEWSGTGDGLEIRHDWIRVLSPPGGRRDSSRGPAGQAIGTQSVHGATRQPTGIELAPLLSDQRLR